MVVARPLSLIFAQHLAEGAWIGPGPADLEQPLAALWQGGRRAWPELALPAPLFIRHLAARAPPGDARRFLAAVAGSDLYLACACAQGLPAALMALDRAVLSRVPSFIARVSTDPSFIDEVQQHLRERLLLAPPGAAPKIAEYGGAGALQAFVRVAALRTALNLRRNRDEQPHEDVDDRTVQALPGSLGAELRYVQERHRADLLSALRDAFAALPQEQRHVLRLHFASGLTAVRIAQMLQVDRTTVGRWLASARAAALSETRRLLRERLCLAPQEVDSLIAVLRSQLGASITGLLQSTPG